MIGVPSFVVTLAGLLAWQGVILYAIGDQGVIVIEDATINNVANYFFSTGRLRHRRRSRARVRARRPLRASSVGGATGSNRQPRSSVALKVLGFAAIGLRRRLWANRSRGFPVAVVLVIVLLVFWTWVAERTTFGRHVYAVGGNAEAARRAGINVRRIRIIVFVISGAMAALGGVIFASRLNSVDLNAGGGTILLDAIAAAVIGGTSLFGGRGRVISALMGSLVIATVANGIDLLGYSSAIKYMVTGAILLAAVTLDTVSRRRLERGRALARAHQPRHLGPRPDGHALRPGRLPARARGRDDGAARAPRRRGPRRPDRRLRVPLPGASSPENLDEVREALDGHGIYTICTGLHLDPRFGRGGLVSPDPGGARRGAAAHPRDAEIRRLGRRAHDLLARDRGLQLPVPDAVRRVVGVVPRRDRRGGRGLRGHGVKLFLEHKNSEPAMKILMRNIGMTLHVIHKLRAAGITNVQVNMDWQHLIMNGESLGEYAAMLAAEGLLGHQHANSGWGTFDDDNMVGATAFMETLELAVELRRAGYGENGERLGFDLYPYTEDAVAAVARSVKQWSFIWDVSGADRRRGAARGAVAQGRRARLRARLRRARRLTWGTHGFPVASPPPSAARRDRACPG